MNFDIRSMVYKLPANTAEGHLESFSPVTFLRSKSFSAFQKTGAGAGKCKYCKRGCKVGAF